MFYYCRSFLLSVAICCLISFKNSGFTVSAVVFYSRRSEFTTKNLLSVVFLVREGPLGLASLNWEAAKIILVAKITCNGGLLAKKATSDCGCDFPGAFKASALNSTEGGGGVPELRVLQGFLTHHYPKNLLRLFFRNNLARQKITSENKNNLARLFLCLF